MARVDAGRVRIGFVVAGLLVVAWLAWITLSIARQPVPGETSLGALSGHVQQALVARDAEALGGLVDYPQADAPDFAQRYLDALGPDTGALTVTPDTSRGLLTIGGQRRGGPPFTYAVRAVQNQDGRWLVSFLPPV